MSACFGIHVGNTSMCLANSREGRTEVVANEAGDRVTPATGVFDGKNLEVCLPLKATSRRKAVICYTKRLFNGEITLDEAEIVNERNDCKIVYDEDEPFYEINTEEGIQTYTPKNIMTKFFGKMFNIAMNAACAEGDIKTVIAVPPHWSDEDRLRFIESAEAVGFNLLQAINEPTAAMLAYDLDAIATEENAIVYRLGGTSCDITLMRSVNGVLSMEKTRRYSGIGGQYITKDLAAYIASEFFQKWKLNPQENKRAMEKLFHCANDCKHILSMLSSAHISIESLYEGIDWNQNISRARYENVISSKLDACIAPLRGFLAEIESGTSIGKVVLCGGSMKIPRLQSMISELLPNAAILNSLSPDEIIAMGCAKQASLLSDNADVVFSKSSAVVDCITSSIYMKYSDTKTCLFPAGTPVYSQVEIPINVGNFTDKIELNVCNCEGDLGSFSLPFDSKATKVLAVLHDNDLIMNVV